MFAVASSLTTNHSQSDGGGWGFTGTERNLLPLLYHRSIVGRPNTSSRDSGNLEPELKLSPLSPKSPDATASPVTGGPFSPEKALPHPFTDLLEEEAIDGEQGKEEEEKEKEKG